ncbi:acetolactate synthase small subunit [Candidatus Woesearchaeota archaeon CG11_big_fil_rev_8_21_14_0_20_57_5]|nr:MAG: acetolactate synthase small subunit [Candidatus Woesearchaeota archaeon CG11_big_fil_rev_8_21_14_0_20_57_5]
MYSDKKEWHPSHRHVISLMVVDEPGVLTRISNMFFKRNFNIDTLTVSPSIINGQSRITLSFFGDDSVYEQLIKQLNKLIDVIKVSDLPKGDTVIRDLCLVRVTAKDAATQNQLINYCRFYRARIVDATHDDLMVEMVGKPEKIDAFLELVGPLGIKEVSRTGVTALARGNGVKGNGMRGNGVKGNGSVSGASTSAGSKTAGSPDGGDVR